MCKKKQFKYCESRIDDCIVGLLKAIDTILSNHLRIVSCCCGHGVYPMTIVLENSNVLRFEFISGIEIPRKKNFYKKDCDGYYYIPEVSEPRRLKTSSRIIKRKNGASIIRRKGR